MVGVGEGEGEGEGEHGGRRGKERKGKEMRCERTKVCGGG